MAIAASLILCFAAGYLLVGLAFTRTSNNVLLQICLSSGFGFAVFSFTYFVALITAFLHLWIIDIGILAILLAAHVSMRRQRHREGSLQKGPGQTSAPRSLQVAFLIASFAAVYSAVMRALSHPYGNGWDSFAIWNLHARFLYRGGNNWRDGFSPLLPWSHPDYPLLVPAAIAHFWTTAGHETPAVPAIIGLLFTFASIGLLIAGLDLLVGRSSALLGGMALLCSPFFIELGTWQYADVPIAFFFLATLVLFRLSDKPVIQPNWRPGTLALAGFAAGCAAWTKNEGILFLCAIFLSRMVVAFGQRRTGISDMSSKPLQLFPALYGTIPVLCILLFFKHYVAPVGDLFSDRAIMLHKLGEVWRYGVVLKWFGKEFLRFGHWFVMPVPILLLAFHLLVRKRVANAADASIGASALALGLTVAGYSVIYLITPYDLYWHLRFSLSRLLIQVWPSAIFLFFLRLGSLSALTSQGGNVHD